MVMPLLQMMSEVRFQVGVAQQGGGWVISGKVRAEERLRLQLQQGGQVGPVLPQADWFRHQDRCGHVLHKLLPWTNQREARVTTTTGILRAKQCIIAMRVRVRVLTSIEV